jgi:hypothetical protein
VTRLPGIRPGAREPDSPRTRRPSWMNNRSATRLDPLHPVHMHDVGRTRVPGRTALDDRRYRNEARAMARDSGASCRKSRRGEASASAAIPRPCPRHLSSFRPTIPIARAGSGTECSASPSRHGRPRPDPDGRPTPTACASESTSVGRARRHRLPALLHRRRPGHDTQARPRARRLDHPPRRSVGLMSGLRGQPVRAGRRACTR